MATNSGKVNRIIDTFMFFDLETTDLIRNGCMPRITELAMVAVSRNSIVDDKNKMALPRILHKLCIPINPEILISDKVSNLTKIFNDELKNINQFDEKTYGTIMQFIECLPGSVCFVAHNGFNFDYPIFLSEIDNIQKTIPDKILCVDTLVAFKEYFQSTPNQLSSIQSGLIDYNRWITDCWDSALLSALNKYENEALNNEKVKNSILEHPEHGLNHKMIPANLNSGSMSTAFRQGSSSFNGYSDHSSFSNKKQKLNFTQKPKNLKLKTVHAYFMDCEPIHQHSAEADCISLLKCVCQIGSFFVSWAINNAVSLNSFKKAITTTE